MKGVVPASAAEVFKNERRERLGGSMVNTACEVAGTVGERGYHGLRNTNSARMNQSDAESSFDKILSYARGGGIDGTTAALTSHAAAMPMGEAWKSCEMRSGGRLLALQKRTARRKGNAGAGLDAWPAMRFHQRHGDRS